MYRIETDLEELIPVDTAPRYEGERIPSGQYYVEFGGSDAPGYELVQAVEDPDDIDDESVEIVGPDLQDMEEGATTALGVLIEVYIEPTEELDPKNLESVVERRHHEFCNYVQGLMHLNQRGNIQMRLSKDAFGEGVDSLEKIGKAIMKMFKTEQTFLEKIQVTYYTKEEDVVENLEKAREVWTARDKRVRNLHDEDVEKFYGCVLCQSHKPGHACLITPDKISQCGVITYLNAQAAAAANPEGPYFKMDKGVAVNGNDPAREFTGVNEAVKEKTDGAIERFRIYTIFDYVQTPSETYEGIYFYIPDVDGIGFVHRGFEGETPIGLPFSSMAGAVEGVQQPHGFLGGAIEYMRSPKFLQGDGGWHRMVWMPKEIKEELKDAIPDEVYDKIITEEDTRDVNELKKILEERKHPVTTRWVEVTDELVRDTINYIKDKGGKVKPSEADESLGLNEVQFRKVIDEMKDRGILGGEPGGYLDDLDYRWARGEVMEWPWSGN